MSAVPPFHRFRGLLHQLMRLWLWLVEPHHTLHDPELRRRAQLLSTLIVVFVPVVLQMTRWDWLGNLLHLYIYSAAVVLALVFIINRRGHFRTAAPVTTVVLSAGPFVLFLSLQDYNVSGTILALVWTACTIVIGYLLFGLRGTLITAGSHVIAIAALPLLISQLHYSDVVYALFFSIIISGEVIIAAFVREHHWKLLAGQTQALHESEERYRDLFSATVEGIIVHHDGIILDANPAFEAISGYRLEEIIGTSVFRFFSEENRAIVEAAQTSTEPFEARAIRRDGTSFWFEAQAQFHRYRGRSVRIASIRDITERKEAEAHRLELAVEREKVAVLQRFIGDMSHDLRTPLSIMKTSTYLLEKLAHDPAKFRQSLDNLNAQTDHLQRIIEDLLSMSRLDKADTRDYRFGWSNINVLIQEATDEQQTLALRQRVQLRFDPAEVLPNSLIDQAEFKKMIKHLILNSIAHTPEDGSVTIRTNTDDHNLIIEVTDTGAGINALDLPHIFDRFYRADRARGAGGGAGLGLSIAKKIVEAHGGKIEAESQLKHGSTFRVRLPKAANPQPDNQPFMTS